MDRYIYWHAPLWEVLLIILMGLVFVGWLVICRRRRPDLSIIHPALDLSPLFFYDGIQGLTALNPAAGQTLNNLPAAQRPFLLEVLTETLLEAYEESRLSQQPDWPESGHILIAVPISGQPDKVVGTSLIGAQLTSTGSSSSLKRSGTNASKCSSVVKAVCSASVKNTLQLLCSSGFSDTIHLWRGI